MKFEDTPEYKDIRIAALLKNNEKLTKILKDIDHIMRNYSLMEINWTYHILDPIQEGLNGKHIQRITNKEEIDEILTKLEK